MANLTITRVLDSTFEHVLDGGDPIIDNNPNVTVFGDVFNFKTSNGANLIKKQNIRFDEITVVDTFGGTGSFTFVNSVNVLLKLISLKYFDGIAGLPGGGVNRFDELEDGFSFFGQNGKVPVVNESQQKLVPTTFYNFSKFTQLTDVAASSLITGKYVTTTTIGGVVRLVLSDLPPFPDAMVNGVGYFDYEDLVTKTTPLAYTTGLLQLTNDTGGPNTVLNQGPFGVTSIWDAATDTFDFSQLSVGDTVDIRLDMLVDITNVAQTVRLFLLFNEGEANEFTLPFSGDLQYIATGEQKLIAFNQVYIGSESVRDNPVKLLISSTHATDITVNGWYCRILRKAVNVVDFSVNTNIEERVITIDAMSAFYDLDFLPQKIILVRNGISQTPTNDYTLSGVRITPTFGFEVGDLLHVIGFVASTESSSGQAFDPLADHDKGHWDAGTNLPTLVDGVGNRGDYYKVVNGGTVDFGNGNIIFGLGDIVGYDYVDEIWYKKINNNQ